MKLVRLLSCLILTSLISCDGELPTSLEPSPSPSSSPSPSPTPTPVADLCEALRADIFATVDGEGAVAWPLGKVATLTAVITYRGDLLDEDTSTCESLNIVTWIAPHAPQPFCEFQGNFNSSRVRLQCFESGTITVKAIPQGFTIVPAEANFRVQPSDLVGPLPLCFFQKNFFQKQ